jgi:hypothetical protein
MRYARARRALRKSLRRAVEAFAAWRARRMQVRHLERIFG